MRFDSNDVEDFGSVLQEVWANTEIGRTFLADYYSEDDWAEQFEIIRRTAVRVAGRQDVDEAEVERCLYLLMQSGLIRPKQVAAAPIAEPQKDTRPRDKNGKLLTESQIAWAENTRWANEHSLEESRERAKTDEAFATCFRKTFPGQADLVAPVKMVTSSKSPDLVKFADAYNRADSRSLRPINGVVTMNNQKYDYAAFNKLVEACVAERLL